MGKQLKNGATRYAEGDIPQLIQIGCAHHEFRVMDSIAVLTFGEARRGSRGGRRDGVAQRIDKEMDR
ncbi:MAG: hypothetical protein IPN34_17750 [Planctomycetes bacterium]|nr:hypothetical protein [Planctomycetota bacterium]